MHDEINKKPLGEPRLASNSSEDLLNTPHSEKSQSNNFLLLYAREMKNAAAYKGNDNYQLGTVKNLN